MLKSFFKKIGGIIAYPFKKIANIAKNKRISKRIELIKEYIEIAKINNLEIAINSNYYNELIIDIVSPNLKKSRSKKVSDEKKLD